MTWFVAFYSRQTWVMINAAQEPDIALKCKSIMGYHEMSHWEADY